MARCEFGPKPRAVGEGLSRPPGWEGRLQSPAGEGRPSLADGDLLARVKIKGGVCRNAEGGGTCPGVYVSAGTLDQKLGHKEKGWEAGD